jgi:hypothetical protein
MKPIIMRRMMALAALLVSILMSGCAPHPTNSSIETTTVYQDAPTLNPLDLGRQEKVQATRIIFLLRYTLARAVR